MADIRRVIAFVATAGTVCLIAWLGGCDFNERSPALAMAVGSALSFGVMAYTYPFQEKRR